MIPQPTRRRAAIAAVGAVMLVGAAACGSDSDSSTADSLPQATVATATEPNDDTSVPTTAAAPETGAEANETGTTAADPGTVVVPEALQFTAPLVGGGTFDGAAAAGKPTVFWFWAPT